MSVDDGEAALALGCCCGGMDAAAGVGEVSLCGVTAAVVVSWLRAVASGVPVL